MTGKGTAQNKTEVGTCTACGTTVYEYEGPIDARSHPQMAFEVKARDGVILCATCYYCPRIVADVVGHRVTWQAYLTPPAEEPET